MPHETGRDIHAPGLGTLVPSELRHTRAKKVNDMTRPKVPDLEDNGEHACPYTAEGTDRVVADAHHVGFDEG